MARCQKPNRVEEGGASTLLGRIVFLGLFWSIAVTDANAQLTFFGVIEESVYKKAPNRYEQVTPPPNWGSDQMFIERNPGLSLSGREMESIVIEKKVMYKDIKTTARELLGEKPAELQRGDEHTMGHYFQATFILNKEGALHFKQFADKNEGKFFYVTLPGAQPDVIQIRGPFSGKAISTNLRENDLDKLKSAFASFGSKVNWK